MVKRSRVLKEVEADAGLPYEQTALARKAVGARRRVSLFLAGGALAMLLEAALGPNAWWLLGALALGLFAWGVWRGRLGGIIGAALVALLCMLLPLRFLALGLPDTIPLVTGVISFVFGLALLPDVLTLVRDAELQHSYGLWARRDGP